MAKATSNLKAGSSCTETSSATVRTPPGTVAFTFSALPCNEAGRFARSSETEPKISNKDAGLSRAGDGVGDTIFLSNALKAAGYKMYVADFHSDASPRREDAFKFEAMPWLGMCEI